MTIKEFSHKHSLVFFWATVVLAVLLICSGLGRLHEERYGERMRDNFNRGGKTMYRGGNIQDSPQRQMMDSNASDGQVEATSTTQ